SATWLPIVQSTPFTVLVKRRLRRPGIRAEEPSAPMPSLKMQRIDYRRTDAAAKLKALRKQLNAEGNIVSPRARGLPERVFGQALPPTQVVERLCADVRQEGLPAVLHYTEQLDRVRLTRETLRVSTQELAEAHRSAAQPFLDTIRRVRQNILSFQLGLLH